MTTALETAPRRALVDSPPELNFAVERVEIPLAATPTLSFEVRVEAGLGDVVRGIWLSAQIRIAAAKRAYDDRERRRLFELFGRPEQWSTTLRGLLWTHAIAEVGPFSGSTRVSLPVPCTYDFEVVATKYLDAVERGVVPLEFLFSGNLFYETDAGMRIARIPWDREATFALPVETWRELIDRYYPGTAWLRLRRETFERLRSFQTENVFPDWDAALHALLEASRKGGTAS